MEERTRAPSSAAVPARRRDGEAGFTLIELLVVIIIIGILAAIAIPIYLNQRVKSYDAGAKSDLQQLAMLEETYLTDNQTYGSFSQLNSGLTPMAPTRGVTLTIHTTGAAGYCLSAKHADSPNTWYYDSQAGGLQGLGASGCPVTTGGVSGGTLTG
jgi:type IV pilus assembly protein PilA